MNEVTAYGTAVVVEALYWRWNSHPLFRCWRVSAPNSGATAYPQVPWCAGSRRLVSGPAIWS